MSPRSSGAYPGECGVPATQWGGLLRMDGPLGLDLGFLFCSSHYKKVVGADGRKGVGLLDHLPRPG